MRRTTPLLVLAAAFTAANGWIHLDERLNTYANLPASVPGAWVVRTGFWLNAAACAVAAAALIAVAVSQKLERFTVPALAGAALVAGGSIVPLVLSREASVFGWQEPIWTSAAKSALAVEIAALVVIAAVGLVRSRFGAMASRPLTASSPA